MKKIGWGVIGAGGIADRRMIPEGILPAANAELIAIMDTDAAALQRVAAKYPSAQACRTEAELLALPAVEAVYVATPTIQHRPQCLAALAACKHVLCEKPLALSAQEGRQLVRAARDAGRLLGVDYMMRYNVYHRRIAELIRDGAIGRPVLGRAQLTCWYPKIEGAWRQIQSLGGGGALMDLTTHCVDLLEMCLGKVSQVFCLTDRLVQDYEVEDTSLLTLRFQNGALGVIDCHFNIPDQASEYVLEFHGSQGCIKAAFTIGQGAGGDVRCCLTGEAGAYDAAQNRRDAGYQPLKLEERNTYRAIIEDFGQAVAEGRPFALSAEEGLWNLQLMEAAYRSAREERMIKVSGE